MTHPGKWGVMAFCCLSLLSTPVLVNRSKPMVTQRALAKFNASQNKGTRRRVIISGTGEYGDGRKTKDDESDHIHCINTNNSQKTKLTN